MVQKILVLPTWVLLIIFIKYNALSLDHEWYGKKFELTEWSNGSTKLTYLFSIIFWLYPFLLMFVIYKLLTC